MFFSKSSVIFFTYFLAAIFSVAVTDLELITFSTAVLKLSSFLLFAKSVVVETQSFSIVTIDEEKSNMASIIASLK